jgi:hypothetical protein
VLIAPRPALMWRGLTALAIAGLAVYPALQFLWTRGVHAPMRAEWTANGVWRLHLPNGRREDVILLNESAILGPLVFLIWFHQRRRRYAIIDSSSVDPVTFRMLRSRLRLEGNHLRRRLKGLT